MTNQGRQYVLKFKLVVCCVEQECYNSQFYHRSDICGGVWGCVSYFKEKVTGSEREEEMLDCSPSSSTLFGEW